MTSHARKQGATAGIRSRIFATTSLLATLLHPAGAEVTTVPVLPEVARAAFHREARALPGAKQIGLSCAFYANVPALTRVCGIQIVDDSPASRAFVAGIYGLRRGDFEFRSAFDKELFFELFGMNSKPQRHDFPELGRKELLKQAEKLITRVFEPALDRGNFISLRALGPFGGPHNVLLVAHANGKYHYHDPTTGKLHTTGLPGLAANIVAESKRGAQVKKRHFASFCFVPVGGASRVTRQPLRLGQLPDAVDLTLTARQRSDLAAKFTAPAGLLGVEVDDLVKAFPAIDFAVATMTRGGKATLASAVSEALPAKELRGVAHLARLAINSYQIGARDLLPVWIVDGQPHVVTGYVVGPKPVVMLADRAGTRSMALDEALESLKASGSIIGYVEVPRE